MAHTVLMLSALDELYGSDFWHGNGGGTAAMFLAHSHKSTYYPGIAERHAHYEQFSLVGIGVNAVIECVKR